MLKHFVFGFFILCLIFLSAKPASAVNYYISPTGNDANSGLSTQAAIATFDKAWQLLNPGDTLLIMDGTYKQSIIPNVRDGLPNTAVTDGDDKTTGELNPLYPLDHPERTKKYITVKALNDGRAVIDGEYKRQAVMLGNHTQNWKGNYYIIEGIVAKNSLDDVYFIQSHNVIIRRTSGYNANIHRNVHVYTIWTGGSAAEPSNILLEDNFASGYGRKMFVAYASYVNVIFRRNAGLWTDNLSDENCQNNWPNGDNIEIYNWNQPEVVNNVIFENNIALGGQPTYGINLAPNPARTINNKLLGNISYNASLQPDHSSLPFACNNYPAACADPTRKCTADRTKSDWIIFGTGISVGVYGRPYMQGNLIEDNFAVGNYSMGFAAGGPEEGGGWCDGTEASGMYPCAKCNATNADPDCAKDAGGKVIAGPSSRSFGNILNRLSLAGNSIGVPATPVGAGVEIQEKSLDMFRQYGSLGSLYIEGDARFSDKGSGARLRYRYVNGKLMDGSDGKAAEELWPWPMEGRIKSELAAMRSLQNFSVTDTIVPLINAHTAVTVGTVTMTPVPAACPLKSRGDANCKQDSSGKDVGLADFEIWRKEYFEGCRESDLVKCGDDDDAAGSTMDADFNNTPESVYGGEKGVSLADFEIWRKNYSEVI